ncbi:MAG: hypothetical protein ACLT98_14000 [Eggerthellaceae bacterium]
MNGFVLAGVAIAAFAAGAALVSFRYERELRRMARFLDQREPTGNARMTAFTQRAGHRARRGAELDELQNERIASQQARQAFQAGSYCRTTSARRWPGRRAPAAGGGRGRSAAKGAAERRRPSAGRRAGAAGRPVLVRPGARSVVRVAYEPVRPADVLVLAGLYPPRAGREPRVLLDDEAVVQADAEALAVFRNLTTRFAGAAARHRAARRVRDVREPRGRSGGDRHRPPVRALRKEAAPVECGRRPRIAPSWLPL